MYIVLQTAGDFDIFGFESLWVNEGCQREQVNAVRKAIEDAELMGKRNYMQIVEAILKKHGFRLVKQCEIINVSDG